MNVICLVGCIGKDPEFRYLANGDGVCNFSLAVGRPFKNKSTGEYETDWFYISAFGKTAEWIANNCSKGRRVSVTGRMQCRRYQAQDGTERTAWEVRAEQVNGVGPAPEGGTPPARSHADVTQGYSDADAFSDPFSE